MSMNDGNMFASQQFAAEQNWRATGAQMEAIKSVGTTATETVKSLQDLHQKQAELDLHTQQWQVERQIQMQKLAEMQGIDAAEHGRLALEGMRHQNEAADLANKHAKFQLDRATEGMAAISPQERRLLYHMDAFKEFLRARPT